MGDIGSARRKMGRSYRRTKNWRKTAAEFGVTAGMAWRIVKQGYEPHDPAIRLRLGLTAMIPAPACSHCGQVHVSHRCPARRKPMDLFGMPVDELRKALENRKEIGG